MKNTSEHIFNNLVIRGEDVDKEYAESLKEHRENYDKKIFDNITPLEKSEEDLYIIEKYNDYLNQELKELGLEAISFKPEKIQLYNQNDFAAHNDHASGLYFPHNNIIALADRKWRKYPTLMHEMVHAASFHKFNLEKEPTDPEATADYQTLRIGYNAEREEGRNEKFYGFNEGVTELFSKEILNKHKDELIENISFLRNGDAVLVKEFFRPWNYNYHALVKLLLHRLSEETNEPQETFWSKFKKGMMTGNLMHLREIDEVFGQGSLRILAMHGNNKKHNIEITNYFATKDPELKKSLFQKIMEVPE